ncbi:MAG TPA: hypothetical protein IAB17_03420 [Candidatus Alectryocaccobium stercorigallinarum]|nr:hypothetical protein [Candidatus Alectryocaccobium stercorigallinarum]
MEYKIVYPNEVDKDLTEEDIEMDRRAREAVKVALEKAKFLGHPIAKYDKEKKRAYIECPDGRKKYTRVFLY